ncbi:MAG: CHAT domain-containing protein [Alistipes sp.]|nr:CHAT domain-containing protein [Alistipes sp.]
MRVLAVAIVALATLFATFTVSAQRLSEKEISAAMSRAETLYSNENYKEALSVFLSVAANIDASATDASQREILLRSQFMAVVCHYELGDYDKAYKLSKTLFESNPQCTYRETITQLYVSSGVSLAAEILQQFTPGVTQFESMRGMLEELRPLADSDAHQLIEHLVLLDFQLKGLDLMHNLKAEESIACYEQALEYATNMGDESSIMLMHTFIADAYSYLERNTQAIDSFKQALLIAQRLNNIDEQIDIYISLVKHYALLGDDESRSYYSKQLETVVGKCNNSTSLFVYYRHKGDETFSEKRYKLAELWYFKAYAIASKMAEEGDDSKLRNIYVRLARLYDEQKIYDKAFEHFLLALDESNLMLSENYLLYFNLADVSLKIGNMEACESYIETIFSFEPYITEPRKRNGLYLLRGKYFETKGDYESALADYKRADEILATLYSPSDYDRMRTYLFVANLEYLAKNYDEAVYYNSLYTKYAKELYGEYSLDYVEAQISLANSLGFAGQFKSGCDNYSEAVTKLRNIVRSRVTRMTTAQRESFWEPLSSLLTWMTTFAIKVESYQTAYTRTCYDALLMSKAFLLDSERSLTDIVLRYGNTRDRETYSQIVKLRGKIDFWERDYAKNADSLILATKRVDELEEQLMAKSRELGDITSFVDIDYDVVKSNLAKDEVLIDFTEYLLYEKEPCYAAYIINRSQQYPLLTSLFSDKEIEALGITYPDMYYRAAYASDVLQLLWKPLEKYVAKGSTIYYVPTQLLFQVCLESIPLEDGTLLGDHYNFVRLSSARELVRIKQKDKMVIGTAKAVLYGGLNYDLEPKEMLEEAKCYDLESMMITRGNDVARGSSGFSDLPGSKIEVEKISEILANSNVNVTIFMGGKGTEESFLSLNRHSPKILHIATHGFYFTPSEASSVGYLKGYSDAMSLSGLIMSGGNAAWQGKKLPAGVLGGVLTANDIARLDLSDTDMVVLSACQSGQGNATPEGLYGLQRAFKKAGVGTMIMTLWSISDLRTTEFMTLFYQSLVANDWDKHKAFNEAKREMRRLYPNPQYWAAFVMLD